VANDYSTSTDAFADIVDGGYSSSDYAVMATFVTVASRLIDKRVGRWAGFFYPTTDSATRYFDGSGETEQKIDEAVSITSLAVAETGETTSTGYTTWSSTNYLTWPYNETPIKKLIVDWNGDKGHWYAFRKSVQVAGVFGYSSSTPEIIAQVCRRQAVRWYMQAKQAYQNVGASEENKLTYDKLDPDLEALLMPYILEFSE
jgi:hypothetical protein